MTDTISPEADTAPAADPAGAARPQPDDGWQTAKNGRQFASNPGGGWPVWRRGDESVQEALLRAAEVKPDRAPKSKRKRQAATAGAAAKAPADVAGTTRKIEEACAAILTAPAIGCAMFGDEWGANHFQVQGERFAATLARSSEHNPWLRARLEKLTEGELAIAAVLTSVSLTAAAAGYIAPPVIKYMNLPVHPRARAMLGVPPDPADQLAARRAQQAPPAGDPQAPAPGSVPITDALSDPAQVEALASMFTMVNGIDAEVAATMSGDAPDDLDQGLSEPT